MTIFYRRYFWFGGTFLIALLLASESGAAKKPKNPRYAKAKKAAAAADKPKPKIKEPVAPAPPPRPRLAEGRWRPEVKKALEDLAYEKGKTALLYDARRPPAAVLPWDDAAILNDVSETAAARMIERVDFKFDDAFWRLIPLGYGHQQLRAMYEELQQEPESSWPHQVVYQKFRKDFVKSYQGMCGKAGRKECRVWLTRLLAGFRDEELAAYAQGLIRAEFQRPLDTEKIRLGAGDLDAATIRRGLAAIPEMKELCRFLLDAGFDVWVVGDDPQWFLAAGVKEYGIDPSRAVGIRLKTGKDGRLTSDILEPVPFRGGKAEVVASMIGRSPALVIGADPWDIEMMEFGAGRRLLLDKGDGALRRLAEGKGWLIQPAFDNLP